MKILITGADGQVGSALKKTLKDYELVTITRKDCDLRIEDQIKKIIDQHLPDLIINSAAYTKVDQAESEIVIANEINRDAPKTFAEKAFEYDIPFIHFSTDYVFDGQKKGKYTEDDIPCPLGVYGKSKFEGENAIKKIGGKFYIFRTSWIYSNIKNNFYFTIKRQIQKGNKLKIVSDQNGVPTSNYFIAKQIKKIIPLLNKNNIGIYNLVPDGSCSWYEFAKKIIDQVNPDFIKNIYPIDSENFPSNAKRPLNSCLDNKKVKKMFMLEFEDWFIEFKKFTYEA